MFLLSCLALGATAVGLQHVNDRVLDEAMRPSLRQLEAQLDEENRRLDHELASLLFEHRYPESFPPSLRVTRELEAQFEQLEEEKGDDEKT